MQGGRNQVVLVHPKNGAVVVLFGTQHVSATHGCAAKEAIQSWVQQPPTVVLEIDQVTLARALCDPTKCSRCAFCTVLQSCKRSSQLPASVHTIGSAATNSGRFAATPLNECMLPLQSSLDSCNNTHAINECQSLLVCMPLLYTPAGALPSA